MTSPIGRCFSAVLLVAIWGKAQAVPTSDIPLDAVHWVFVGGKWSVVEGSLVQSQPEHLNRAFFTAGAWSSPTLTARFRIRDVGSGVQAAGLILCSQDSSSGYHVHYDARNDQIILSRLLGNERQELTRKRGVPLAPNQWYEARASVADGKLEVFLDGTSILTATDAALPGGRVGVYTSQGAVEYAQVSVAGQAMELGSWRTVESWEVPREQHGATILETRVIAKEPGRYLGWPTICRRRNGELLVVFSGDRDEHVCPWGKVQLVRSMDDGATWSDPVVICNTPLDDRDAGIIETRQGTLVVNWFTSLAFEGSCRKRAAAGDVVARQWLLHAGTLTPEVRAQWFGYWTRRSEDGGKTWSDPVRHVGTTPHGPIELADGRLLLVGRRQDNGVVEMVVEESTDDARSWQVVATIKQSPDDDPNEYYEPHLVEANDGTLVAMFRFHYRTGPKQSRALEGCYLRQAESQDGGKTWTAAHPVPLLGYPPHLLRLRDERLLCVWGRRLPPFGEYACLSNDNGQTWDADHQIRLAAALDGDLGYPASAELADGRILTVYYQIDRPGEKTSLLGTLWRPMPRP